jgi:predicted dithiol-disulfide oxidoreductase (DUF899 family)
MIMLEPRIASHAEWLAARKALLAEEKAFTKARDALSAKRREMPWVKVEKNYVFTGPKGKESLSDLFEGRSQLIVYHFMYGPDWEQGCKSCSFWADNFNGIIAHLNQRDVSMVVTSTAPVATLQAFASRMGWDFKWLSSGGTTFNQDYGVSPAPGKKLDYNYGAAIKDMTEMPGVSVFARDKTGAIHHTYSTYGRGLDMLNGAYHLLDLVPKGRDEEGLPFTMSWLKHRDSY